MADDQFVLIVTGVGPTDVPVHDTDPDRYDEAAALADDLFQLLREDYDKDVDSFKLSGPTSMVICESCGQEALRPEDSHDAHNHPKQPSRRY